MTSAAQEPETLKLKSIWLNITVAAVFALAAFALTLWLLWWGIDSTSPDAAPGPVPTHTPSGGVTTPGVGTAARLDMVKVALTVVAGIGGLVALVVAYRRQKVTEAADRHQRDVAADTKHDLAERRITELYTNAVEQLGSDKAPVRLGGLYALERLAQNNIEHRQTIIDVLCAYLRMPFTPPETPPRSGATRTAPISGEAAAADDSAGSADDQPPISSSTTEGAAEHLRRQEELQVRLTAQDILTRHLTRPDDLDLEEAASFAAHTAHPFWHGNSVNLANAHLTDFNLRLGYLADATFRKATFSGRAGFDGATFSGDAGFGGATFSGDARFDWATFSGGAGFDRATFSGDAGFDRATFSGGAGFDGATFHQLAMFGGETISGDYAGFGGATFSGGARFDWATFHQLAMFGGATFSGNARFGGATFHQIARFRDATFQADPDMSNVHVTDVAANHVWPVGWIVVPADHEPGREQLVRRSYSDADPAPDTIVDGSADNWLYPLSAIGTKVDNVDLATPFTRLGFSG